MNRVYERVYIYICFAVVMTDRQTGDPAHVSWPQGLKFRVSAYGFKLLKG